jgi:hypothetical protein
MQSIKVGVSMRNCVVILLALGCGAGTCLDLSGQTVTPKQKVSKLPWSFYPPVRPNVPAVKNAAWVRNPIDAFVLTKLESKGITPSPAIAKEKLLRRVYLDLIGLPPTPAEVQGFVADQNLDAYEKVVDRLLNSPHYGEHWAMYWLDLVRFAESDGFKADDFRPNAWRYRDYVIQSFNDDKAYDRFILEQLAGDELYPDDSTAIVATAFNRHYPDEHNARNLAMRRQEILNDMTDVTAQVFLGLTLGCARCHDHKYDPIPQVDYYRFQAFFAAFSPRDDLPLAEGKHRQDFEQQLLVWQTKAAPILDKMAKLEEPYRNKLSAPNKSKFSKEYQDAFDLPFAQRTPWQKQIADMVAKQVRVDQGQMVKSMKPEVKKEWDDLNKELHAFDDCKPRPLPITCGITDIGSEAPPTFVFKRGNPLHPMEKVQPGFLSAVTKTEPLIPASTTKTTGRRAVLAKWLADTKNPLTARVMVNRLWQHHFGRGIVGTASDFGAQGDRPSHAELLDWLATEFMSRGWSMKAMHRLMVTSNTYRQSSTNIPANTAIDPDNRLLWKMNLRRLEGEVLRDAMLSAVGKLNFKMGGPSVFPPLPKGITPAYGWKVTPDASEHSRRSVYIVVKRNLRYPLFSAFDAPDSNESCARRNVCTNAPQALLLINDEFTLQVARDFASRLLHEKAARQPNDVTQQAYALLLGRSPDDKELALSSKFFQQHIPLIQKRLTDKLPVAFPPALPPNVEPAFAAATVEYCHVLLNLNEFAYVD